MFTYMGDKGKLLKDLQFHESGYQSINNLYKEAKEKDNTITLNYVKGWYKHFSELRTQLKGPNNQIALDPSFEYQLDFFLQTNQNQIQDQRVLIYSQNTQLLFHQLINNLKK